MKFFSLFFLILLLNACTAPKKFTQSNLPEFDKWIYNGVVLMPNGKTEKNDILIQKGTIVLVTNLTAAEKTKITATAHERIDAKGNFIMPGFIDAHAHFIALGKSKVHLNFSGTVSWEQIVQLVKEKAAATPKGEWITGHGWHQEKWPLKTAEMVEGFPVHDLLSKVSPDHPVVLTHASGHGLIANGKAMEIAEISKDSPVPEGGIMLLKKDGTPSGIFQENAMSMINRVMEKAHSQLSDAEKHKQFLTYLRLAEEECLSQGITTVHDAGIEWESAQKFKHLAEQKQLNIRLYSMMSDFMLQNTPRKQLRKHIESTRNNRFFTNTAVKVFADGALGSRGAWFIEDYTDMPGNRGKNVTPLENMRKSAELSEELNLQLCVHAIGDRGNREVLNIFEAVMGHHLAQKRWRIEHAQHLNPTDIERIAQHDIIASMQTVHCTSDAPYVVKRIGEKRAEEGAYVWRTLLQKNVSLANGTDAPIERINPFENLYAAVTRRQSDNGKEFYPNQKLTRLEALQIYTRGNAYAAFQESWKGNIEEGFVADLIILDKNLLECTDREIPQTRVLYTLVDGEIKYKAE